MTIRVGTIFKHARVLDASKLPTKVPLEYKVTKIAGGIMWYRPYRDGNYDGGSERCQIDRADEIMMPDRESGEPSTPYRTKPLIISSKRQPRNSEFCILCRKDMKYGQMKRRVLVINGGASILHPEDLSLYIPDSGDLGWHLIGMDCARQIGLEWSAECSST